ncbi:hypothetical protein CDAR_85531 [Caerostris darwini]|uniref:Uncharacterized protein n=1 Tax=Caerostris darwini TaxID=1538125 RepID=A0AAV4R1L1_9ARAC|nr:hypothetical protein CDAR_85531 [Caerostris darwini]
MKRHTCIHKFSEKGFLVKRKKSPPTSDSEFCVCISLHPKRTCSAMPASTGNKNWRDKRSGGNTTRAPFFRESRQETQWETGTTNLGANFKDLSVVPGKQRCVKPEK